jgi:preprotein translocase subunit SecD
VKNFTWKWVLILGVIAFSVFSYWHNGRQSLIRGGKDPAQITLGEIARNGLKLGLDLKGGIHLVLRVKTDDALRVVTDEEIDRVKRVLKDANVAIREVKRDSDTQFTILLASDADADRAGKAAQGNPEFAADERAGTWIFRMNPNAIAKLRDETVRQATQTIRNRIDEFGVSEPVIQPAGHERILVQLPGIDDPGRAKRLIKTTAQLYLKLVEAGPSSSKEALLAAYPAGLPENLEIVEGEREPMPGEIATPGSEWYLVRKEAMVTGRDLKNARRSQDQMGQHSVLFTLNAQGADKFGRGTGENVGKRLGIILDGKMKTAPTIQSQIHDTGTITGSFTIERADDLALVLRSGALPAGIDYLEERTVGPSLGADSIKKGITAALLGMLFVYVFMLIYYKGSGINAAIALTLNSIILVGVMANFGATLTLPGIAGFILTVGMAVDSNVLIFERIREELRHGKTVRSAIDAGFSKAFATIIDTHATTLISAAFLFQFGTGPVKGFAVTLTIGLLASIFTAVFVSRFIFDWWHRNEEQIESLSI